MTHVRATWPGTAMQTGASEHHGSFGINKFALGYGRSPSRGQNHDVTLE